MLPHGVAANPRRILLCIATLQGGGAERQLTYVCRGLVEAGWDVHVAVLALGVNAPALRSTGARIHVIAHRGNFDPRILIGLLVLVHKLNPRIVYSWLPLMDTVAGMATLGSSARLVSSERSSAKAYAPDATNRLRQLVMRMRSSAIITNSQAGMDFVCERVRPSQAVVRAVIPNGFPLGEIEALPAVERESIGFRGGDEIILFAGRFTALKNLEGLMAALPRVFDRRPRSVGVLCGDGPDLEGWRARVAQAGLAERVLLPGYVPNVHAWMKAADVFVLPSFFEGRSNTILEAIACGCPLVVADIAPNREFLDERSAWLVPPDQPEVIADVLVEVLADPVAAAARVRAARRILEEHSLQALTRKHEAVFAQVLGAARTRIESERAVPSHR